jgi:hypothetical protein
MFPERFFATRYFAPRYWPKVGEDLAVIVTAYVASRFTNPGTQSTFAEPKTASKYSQPGVQSSTSES